MLDRTCRGSDLYKQLILKKMLRKKLLDSALNRPFWD